MINFYSPYRLFYREGSRRDFHLIQDGRFIWQKVRTCYRFDRRDVFRIGNCAVNDFLNVRASAIIHRFRAWNALQAWRILNLGRRGIFNWRQCRILWRERRQIYSCRLRNGKRICGVWYNRINNAVSRPGARFLTFRRNRTASWANVCH